MNFTIPSSGNGIRVCFCGPNATQLSPEPLTAHHPDCLMWDWALQQGMISPAWRLAQLAHVLHDMETLNQELDDDEQSP